MNSLLRVFIQEAMKQKSKLDPSMGTLGTAPATVLVHSSERPLKGPVRIVSGTDRLIPRSFSLGTKKSVWSFYGRHKAYFKIAPGTPMLTVDKDQFYEWGEEEDTPLNRGKLIADWARSNGVSVVKMALAPVMDTEFAVLDPGVLERVESKDT